VKTEFLSKQYSLLSPLFCEAESFSIPHPSSTDIYLYITSSPEARKLKELLANEASDGARCLRYLHPSMRSFTL